ncbi:hypothetical protein B842_03465 [Corynebacterium humireducens NBRC 106098 = DSM 45392]|uniref:Uncharacterized protein n=1 Tax=Corynebacterium humireducens NBRC 106098 = DSM 45392 TaxID=1223515 RepID=A0A0B5D1M8_9CORY|nr:hypothetical protein [Corynebacterium humireducens]AJE32546.1 hypothetical protein B842_03465 [Corynebacterium humireducens NBRC 106098 = DSM 45392]
MTTYIDPQKLDQLVTSWEQEAETTPDTSVKSVLTHVAQEAKQLLPEHATTTMKTLATTRATALANALLGDQGEAFTTGTFKDAANIDFDVHLSGVQFAVNIVVWHNPDSHHSVTLRQAMPFTHVLNLSTTDWHTDTLEKLIRLAAADHARRHQEKEAQDD